MFPFQYLPTDEMDRVASFPRYIIRNWPGGCVTWISPTPAVTFSRIRTVQSLLYHADVSTIMIYLHVIKRPGAGAPSPLDLD